MSDVRFKLLRCDAEASHLLGWAKKEVKRLVDHAGLEAFQRTWLHGDVTVKAHYFGGLARLWLEAAPIVSGWGITKVLPPQIGKKLYVEAFNTGVGYLTRAVYEDGVVAAEVRSTFSEVVTGYNPVTGNANAWHSEWTGYPLQDQTAYRVVFSGGALYTDSGWHDTYLGSSRSIVRNEIAPEAFTDYISDVSSGGPLVWDWKTIAGFGSGTQVVAGIVLYLAFNTQVYTAPAEWYYAVSGITGGYSAPLPTEVGHTSISTVDYVLYPATYYYPVVNDYSNTVLAARRVVQGTKRTTLVSQAEDGAPVYTHEYSAWVDLWAAEGTKVYDDAWAAIGGWKYITEFAVQDLGAYGDVTAIQPFAIDVGAAAQYASDKQQFRALNAEKRYTEAKAKSDATVAQVNASLLPVSVIQAIREARPSSGHLFLSTPMVAEITAESTETTNENSTSPPWTRATTTTHRTVKMKYEYLDEQGVTQDVEQEVIGTKTVVLTTYSPYGNPRVVTDTTYDNWLNFSTPQDLVVGSTGAPVQWVFVRDSYDTGIAEIWNGRKVTVGAAPGNVPPELFGGTYDPPLPPPEDSLTVSYPQILMDYRDRYRPQYRPADTATNRPWQDSLFKHGEQVAVFLLSTVDALRGDVGMFIAEPGAKICYGWAVYKYDYATGSFGWVSYTEFKAPVVLTDVAMDYNCVVRWLNVGWKDVQELYKEQAKTLRETPEEDLTPEETAYLKLQKAVLDALTPQE